MGGVRLGKDKGAEDSGTAGLGVPPGSKGQRPEGAAESPPVHGTFPPTPTGNREITGPPNVSSAEAEKC